MRVIEYTVHTTAQDSGDVTSSECFTLVTDLLDIEAYPALELACAYPMRWECETVIGHHKTDMGPGMPVLRSKDPEGVAQEMWAMFAEMDTRYDRLDTQRRRKITPQDADDGVRPVVVVIDELAYYSATVGTRQQRESFAVLVRDLVARGRAAGIIVIAATQRPSSDIIPTSLRDLFGYRWAFRCTTDASSDIILGHGWASRGHSAADIAPEDKGIGLLLAEGGEPKRIKSAYLSDEQIYNLADTAALLRFGRDIAEHTPPGAGSSR